MPIAIQIKLSSIPRTMGTDAATKSSTPTPTVSNVDTLGVSAICIRAAPVTTSQRTPAEYKATKNVANSSELMPNRSNRVSVCAAQRTIQIERHSSGAESNR